MRFSRRNVAAAAAGIAILIAVPSARAQPGEEAAVTRAVDAFKDALLTSDKATLEALLAPEASYGHSSSAVENRQQFIETIMAGTLVPKWIELSERQVTIVGNDAIVRHNFTAEAANKAGQTIPIRIGLMEVWQKRGNNWMLLAHQAYPRPKPT